MKILPLKTTGEILIKGGKGRLTEIIDILQGFLWGIFFPRLCSMSRIFLFFTVLSIWLTGSLGFFFGSVLFSVVDALHQFAWRSYQGYFGSNPIFPLKKDGDPVNHVRKYAIAHQMYANCRQEIKIIKAETWQKMSD